MNELLTQKKKEWDLDFVMYEKKKSSGKEEN